MRGAEGAEYPAAINLVRSRSLFVSPRLSPAFSTASASFDHAVSVEDRSPSDLLGTSRLVFVSSRNSLRTSARLVRKVISANAPVTTRPKMTISIVRRAMLLVAASSNMSDLQIDHFTDHD